MAELLTNINFLLWWPYRFSHPNISEPKYAHGNIHSKVPRGFEPRSLDLESRVLTVTPRDQLLIDTINEGENSSCLLDMNAYVCIIRSISGLVAEYIVAIDVTRARFPADAFSVCSHTMFVC